MTAAGQIPLDLGHRPAMGAEDFLLAASNRAAVAWLDRWPGWPSPALVLWGPPGSGKTHLTQVWRRRSGAIPADLACLQEEEVRGALGPARAAVIDDADRLAGGQGEVGLFHLHNLLAERGGHLLLTGRSPPARWPLALPDLASRLRAAPAVAVSDPDDALLAAVLVKLFADRQVAVPREVLAWLVPRMERSLGAARALVAAIDARSLAAKRPVTIALVRPLVER